MILNLEKKVWTDYLRKALLVFSYLKTSLFRRRQFASLYTDSMELKRLYSSKFPTFIESVENNMLCVSCGLCEVICPTDAMSLEKSKMFDIPQSLTQGEIPKALKLDLELCNKCSLCTIICPVSAIDMQGSYSDLARVDLVANFNQKIEQSEMESQN